MATKTGSFNSNLTAMREQSQLSVQRLAELSGLTKAYIYALESGDSDPSLKTLTKLAAAFGMTVSELLEGETSPRTDKLRRMVVNVNVVETGECFDIELLAYTPAHALDQARAYLGNNPLCDLKWEYVDAEDTLAPDPMAVDRINLKPGVQTQPARLDTRPEFEQERRSSDDTDQKRDT